MMHHVMLIQKLSLYWYMKMFVGYAIRYVISTVSRGVRTILKRQKSATIPPLPKVRADVTLAGKWTETEDGRRFLMPITDNDTLVFATDDNLRHLSTAGTIYSSKTRLNRVFRSVLNSTRYMDCWMVTSCH